MDKEHKIMLEELSSIRTSVLTNQKILQWLLQELRPDAPFAELIELNESDQKLFIESIQARLKD